MDDGFEYGFDGSSPEDEDQAATESALQRERDEIEEARADDTPARPSFETPPIDIASTVANDACGYAQYAHALSEHGFAVDATPVQLTLGHLDRVLVLSGLEMLGTLHPHVSAETERIAQALLDAQAMSGFQTKEEKTAYEDANASLAASVLGVAPPGGSNAGLN